MLENSPPEKEQVLLNPGFQPAIIRAPFDKLTIYDVTAEELQILERESSDSIFLNFSIALLSVAISFTVTIFTTEIKSERTFIVLVVMMILGYITGIVLFALWWRSRRIKADIISTIKKRLPPPN